MIVFGINISAKFYQYVSDSNAMMLSGIMQRCPPLLSIDEISLENTCLTQSYYTCTLSLINIMESLKQLSLRR